MNILLLFLVEFIGVSLVSADPNADFSRHVGRRFRQGLGTRFRGGFSSGYDYVGDRLYSSRLKRFAGHEPVAEASTIYEADASISGHRSFSGKSRSDYVDRYGDEYVKYSGYGRRNIGRWKRSTGSNVDGQGRRPSGGKSDIGRLSGRRSSSRRSSGGRLSGGRSSGRRSSGGRLSGGRSSGRISSGGRLSGGRSSGRRSSGGRPSGGRSSGRRSSGGRLNGGRSGGERSSSRRSGGGRSGGGITGGRRRPTNGRSSGRRELGRVSFGVGGFHSGFGGRFNG